MTNFYSIQADKMKFNLENVYNGKINKLKTKIDT